MTMSVNMLASLTGFQWVFTLALLGTSVLLILIVLIQKGRGGGLASAFGGGGGGGAFGAKTGDMFTLATVVIAFVYLLLNVGGNYVFRPATTQTTNRVLQPAAPVGGAVPISADQGTAPTGTDTSSSQGAGSPDTGQPPAGEASPTDEALPAGQASPADEALPADQGAADASGDADPASSPDQPSGDQAGTDQTGTDQAGADQTGGEPQAETSEPESDS